MPQNGECHIVDRLTIRQLQRMTVKLIEANLPFEVTTDGEVLMVCSEAAQIDSQRNTTPIDTNHSDSQATDTPTMTVNAVPHRGSYGLSKEMQAKGKYDRP